MTLTIRVTNVAGPWEARIVHQTRGNHNEHWIDANQPVNVLQPQESTDITIWDNHRIIVLEGDVVKQQETPNQESGVPTVNNNVAD